MNLFNNKLEGNYIIFAAGTGIIPFIDLISFTLRYAADKVAREKYSAYDNLLFPNESASFSKIVGKDYKLHLFVSFSDPESAIFIDVCRELDKLDKKYSLNLFEFTVRISCIDKQRWNENFIKKKLENVDIKKVLIIGPVSFMDDIKRDLIASNVADKQQIYLV